MYTSPPKIRSLRATPVNVPLARPHLTASGLVGSAPLVLMDLETDQGLTGHAYVFCYTLIALKPIAGLVEALQPLIQGDAVAPLAVAQKLQGRFRLLGPYQDWAAPILQRLLELKDGFALPQKEAGCGIAWDKDAVERYRLC